MNELARIATLTVSSTSCVEVQKLPEGNFNKTFLLTMNDGKQIVARVPNPNAGISHYTTASEAKDMCGLPVPKVCAWSSRATENTVGSEYIIMEKVNGVELSQKWPKMSLHAKFELARAITSLDQAFVRNAFTSIGSIYSEFAIFAIGPITSRRFLTGGRGSIDVDRGPWHTTEDYITTIGLREKKCIEELDRHPQPEGFLGGPGFYQPTAEAKLSVLDDYFKVVKYLVPPQPSVLAPTLWYGDLHLGNIFVDPQDPTQIVGIIDWQSAHVAPLFQQVHYPSIVDFAGAKSAEGLILPILPENYETLTPPEQESAEILHQSTTLSNTQKALRCQIIALITGVILNDGEAVLKGHLIQLAREWDKSRRT
ncbi:hypothetical protein MMC12_000853 [Toensbergia leucococca]|nr:hypothetical protein [Toensbergia leucococca]